MKCLHEIKLLDLGARNDVIPVRYGVGTKGFVGLDLCHDSCGFEYERTVLRKRVGQIVYINYA